MINQQPFPDPESWLAVFGQAELPVLRHSVSEIERLRGDEDNTNARVLAAVILHDPLLTLRVLDYIDLHRRQRQITDITTVDRAIMMIGMSPFFRDFQNLPVVEDRLHDHPQALLGLLKTINRARRASHWAHEWAVQRRDMDVDEIALATLLNDVAELLMWLYVPEMAVRVRDMQRAEPHKRSAAIQREVYGIDLFRLKLALTSAWRLPALLAQLLDHRQAENPRVLNVKLAVDLARHSENGWDDAALPDDFRALRELLHVNQETLVRRLGLDEATATALLSRTEPG